jgi:hypothetical protein
MGMRYQHLATCSVFALQAQDKETPSTGGPVSRYQFQTFIQGLSYTGRVAKVVNGMTNKALGTVLCKCHQML